MLIFSAFTAAFFLSQFFRHANAVISQDLMREFTLTAGQLGLMTSLFYLAFAAAQLPLGGLLDRHGPRCVTSLIMMAAVPGCLLFASANSFSALGTGRALIGLGAAIPLAWLNEIIGWRTVFYICATLVVLSVAAIAIWARSPTPQSPGVARSDPVSSVIVRPATIAAPAPVTATSPPPHTLRDVLATRDF
ncbi:MAG: MFS transporter [Actinobacteria bacterium]|nr:MFS transporter [Actinomycetota bacterium]